jgi:hypothetical protein
MSDKKSKTLQKPHRPPITAYKKKLPSITSFPFPFAGFYHQFLLARRCGR